MFKTTDSIIVWIKNLYNKLRLRLSWKFPLFYDYLCAAKFPLQILGVGLATVVAVSLYNSHFSYEASLRKLNEGKLNQFSTSELDNLIVTTQSSPASSPEQLEVTLPPDEGTPSTQADFNPHSAHWVQQQPEDHYVVQVASATKQQLLIQYAQDKAFKPPVAIYPFKVNKEGELVYGMSTGLFIAKDDALTELPVLSKQSEEHGVWVRKVADITEELAALKDSSLLQ